MYMTRTAVIAAFLPVLALAQSAAPRPEFEVASIRPVGPTEQRVDLGMHVDGAQVRFNFLSLRDCMRIAYQMKDYQFVGPDWIGSDRYNITAKLPAGAGQDQVREMLQNLLLDRFKMTVHHDTKDFPVYALVPGKNGIKLKESAPDAADAAGVAAKPALDVKASGSAAGVFVDLGNGSFFTFADNHLVGHKMPMWRLADMLSTFMDKPVIDMTGASTTTNYDLSLEITPEDYRTMQIRSALRNGVSLPAAAAQLADLPTDSLTSALENAGLRLDSRKAAQDVIVIDKADKTPTEN
jgi:uncharacterized protein (TIGR03435 family)